MAITPNGRPGDASPLAKPGYKGPRRLSDYEREIAHALMRKGRPKRQAIRIARGLLNKANKTGRWGDHGKAHAATRAGAAASAAQRATFANEDQDVLDLAKKRPGSMANGKYPVTSAKSAKSAYKLRNHGKGVSAAAVKAHIRAECKKRGIPLPKAMRDHANAGEAVDLARRPFRYRHGWIKIGSAEDTGSVRTKMRVKDPVGRASRNRQRATYALMREQSRRQARVGRRASGGNALPFTGKHSGDGPFRVTISNLPRARHLLANEADRRGLVDLVARWKHGWIPLNPEAVAIHEKMKSATAGRAKSKAQQELDYHAHVNKLESEFKAKMPTHASEVKYGHRAEDGSIVWDKERTKLHRALVEAEFRKQIAEGAQRGKKAVFLGGLPGAGKSSGLKATLGDVENQYITVNPDIFKERMAAGGHIDPVEGMSPLEASAFHHEESSRMAAMLTQLAMNNNYNIIHDITMNNESSVTKRLDPLKSRGYDTSAMFFDIPHEFSAESVRNRHRRGYDRYHSGEDPLGQRYVPSSFVGASASVRGASSKNREAFDATKHLFGGHVLFDQGTTYRMHPAEVRNFRLGESSRRRAS